MLAAASLTLFAVDADRPPYSGTLGALTVAGDSCDSVFVWSRVGWMDQAYKGALRQWDPTVEFPQSYLMLVLNELGAAVRFDGPLDFSMLADIYPTDSVKYDFMPVGGIGTFGAHGLYGFSYESEGRLTKSRVLVSSLSKRVDSAIVRAVRAASDSGHLPKLPKLIPAGVELRLTLGTWVRDDSMAAIGPLFRVRQPVFDQVTYPEQDPKATGVVHYPLDAVRQGVEGEVDVELVVRADGTVDLNSVLIPRATATPFARNAVQALAKTRYKPARVAGCPIAALMTQPFAFKIPR